MQLVCWTSQSVLFDVKTCSLSVEHFSQYCMRLKHAACLLNISISTVWGWNMQYVCWTFHSVLFDVETCSLSVEHFSQYCLRLKHAACLLNISASTVWGWNMQLVCWTSTVWGWNMQYVCWTFQLVPFEVKTCSLSVEHFSQSTWC